LRYNQGKVQIFEHTKSKSALSPENLDVIAKDLTGAFSNEAVKAIGMQNENIVVTPRPKVEVKNIEHVTVITWNDMANTVTLKVNYIFKLILTRMTLTVFKVNIILMFS